MFSEALEVGDSRAFSVQVASFSDSPNVNALRRIAGRFRSNQLQDNYLERRIPMSRWFEADKLGLRQIAERQVERRGLLYRKPPGTNARGLASVPQIRIGSASALKRETRDGKSL